MKPISLVNTAHNLIREQLKPGDIAIDATVGNGHDTLFLAEQVAPSGHVYGFDIQAAAIETTFAKFRESPLANCLTLRQVSHAAMNSHIPTHHFRKIKAIMFNLGYLPGGDKNIITLFDTTLSALIIATEILANNGIITLLAYPGHTGGDLETRQIEAWLMELDNKQFSVETIYSAVHHDTAPRLFVIRKIAKPSYGLIH